MKTHEIKWESIDNDTKQRFVAAGDYGTLVVNENDDLYNGLFEAFTKTDDLALELIQKQPKPELKKSVILLIDEHGMSVKDVDGNDYFVEESGVVDLNPWVLVLSKDVDIDGVKFAQMLLYNPHDNLNTSKFITNETNTLNLMINMYIVGDKDMAEVIDLMKTLQDVVEAKEPEKAAE